MSSKRKKTEQRSGWEEATKIQKLVAMRLVSMMQIVQQSADTRLHGFVDAQALVRDAELLKTDLPTFVERLRSLGETHVGKDGAAKDADDNMELINTVMAYESLNQDIDIVIMPTFLSMSDSISRGFQSYHDQASKEVANV